MERESTQRGRGAVSCRELPSIVIVGYHWAVTVPAPPSLPSSWTNYTPFLQSFFQPSYFSDDTVL